MKKSGLILIAALVLILAVSCSSSVSRKGADLIQGFNKLSKTENSFRAQVQACIEENKVELKGAVKVPSTIEFVARQKAPKNPKYVVSTADSKAIAWLEVEGDTLYVKTNGSYFKANKNCTAMFAGNCSGTSCSWDDNTSYTEAITEIKFNGIFDTSEVEDMEYMFCECTALTDLDVSCFDTSNVRRMNRMFSYCVKLKELDISNFDTSKVWTTRGMFGHDTALKNLIISDKFVEPQTDESVAKITTQDEDDPTDASKIVLTMFKNANSSITIKNVDQPDVTYTYSADKFPTVDPS